MKFLVVVALAICSVAAGGSDKKLVKVESERALLQKCFGLKKLDKRAKLIKDSIKHCQTVEPTIEVDTIYGEEALKRVARQAEHSVEHFDKIYAGYKEDVVQGLSNMSCVLKKLEVWNEDETINLDYYNSSRLEGAPFDDKFKGMMQEAYKICHTMSEAVPTELIRDPVRSTWGKQMSFLKCVRKEENRLCAVRQITLDHEELNGKVEEETLKALGLPTNKYMAVPIMKAVKVNSLPKTGKFVWKVIVDGGIF